MDEIAVPLRCPPGGSPTLSSGGHSAHWDNICPVGTLQPAPCTRDVPKLSPLVAHRVHVEPLSGLMFTDESVLTMCREGHIKIWVRPGQGDNNQSSSSETVLKIWVRPGQGDNNQSSSSETVLGTAANLKDRPIVPGKTSSSSYKQPPAILLRD